MHDPHLSMVGLVETGKDVHGRRLAGARGPHRRGQLLRPHVQIDTPEGVNRRVSLAVLAGELQPPQVT